jgi:hypothetical protein
LAAAHAATKTQTTHTAAIQMKLASSLSTSSPEFRENREWSLASLDTVRRIAAATVNPENDATIARHRERGKLTAPRL